MKELTFKGRDVDNLARMLVIFSQKLTKDERKDYQPHLKKFQKKLQKAFDAKSPQLLLDPHYIHPLTSKRLIKDLALRIVELDNAFLN
jgi:hypothetical protein